MIYLINRCDSNPGDYWSSPGHYFEFESFKSLDILDRNALRSIEPGSRCIVGGGGLIKDIFMKSLNVLYEKQCRIVFWGIGERLSQDIDSGYIDRSCKLNIVPASFDEERHLVSMRSIEPGIKWVPCPSCNHSIFDNEFQKAGLHGVGIFQHRRVALHGQGNSFPRLINDPANLEVCIQFIASLKVLITNSYHGMYWAQLLGVPTVCVPFSSGHYAFNGEMTYSTHEDSVSNAKQLLSEYRPEARLNARELILENHRLVSSLFYSQAVEFLVD